MLQLFTNDTCSRAADFETVFLAANNYGVASAKRPRCIHLRRLASNHRRQVKQIHFEPEHGVITTSRAQCRIRERIPAASRSGRPDVHRLIVESSLGRMARPKRFELLTPRFVV